MSAGAALPLPEKLHSIIRPISFRVFAPVKPKAIASVAVEVKHVTDKKHPHRFSDRNLKDFLLDALPIPQRHPSDRLIALTAKQQPAFRIVRHADPRTIFRAIRLKHMFDFKNYRQGLQHFPRLLC